MENFNFKELEINQQISNKNKLIKIWSFLGFFLNIIIIYLMVKILLNPDFISEIKKQFNIYLSIFLFIEYILAFSFYFQIRKLKKLKSLLIENN
jgi:amino acid permease